MDYDENDFQNQNNHLAGEGNNKFPPVSNPYALPKFDFDDNLQGHLRFDNLVETEVFLGIGSNEDNRWIEDFSRGSCGIDFSKSAADSCSISRHNNVWSEATSSESVEMLLKSVGQEETIPKQNIVEVSDAFDELGCLTKRMEANDGHDTIFSEIDGVQDLQPAFAIEQVPKDSSRLKNDLGTSQSHVEVSLQTDHGESVENSSSNLDLDTGEKGLPDEGYLLDGGTCSDASGRDVNNLVTGCAKIDADEDISCSEIKVDDVLRDSGNVIVEDKLKSQECQDPTNDASVKDDDNLERTNNMLSEELLALKNKSGMDNKKTGGDMQNVDNNEMDQQNSNVNAVESITSHLDGAAQLESNAETIEENARRTVNSSITEMSVPEGNTHSVTVESVTSHLDGSAHLESNMEIAKEENTGRTVESAVMETSVLEGGTHTVTVHGCGEEIYSETTTQACSDEDVPPKDESTTEKSNENVYTNSPTVLGAVKEIEGQPVEIVDPEYRIDSSLQIDHVEEKCKAIDGKLVGGELEGNSMAISCSVEDKVDDGDADRGQTCNTAEVQMDAVAADTMGSPNIEVRMEDSNVENQGLFSAYAGSMETEVNGQGDAPNPDSVSVCQEDNIVLPPISSNKDGTIGMPVITDQGFVVPSVSVSGNNEDVIDDHKEVQKSAEVVLQSTHLEKENDAEVDESRDLSTQPSGSNVAAEQVSLSAPVETVCSAPGEQSFGTTIPEYLPTLETDKPGRHCESQTAETGVSQLSSNIVEVTVNPVDVRKGDSCTEAVIAPDKRGVSTIQEKCEMEREISVGDSSKAIESTLVTESPLPEGVLMPDAPEDWTDHRDSDQSNSDTQLASRNGSLSVSGKERGGSEMITVQDVGISGAQKHVGKDGPQVPGPTEINLSKDEKSSTPKIGEASPLTPGPVQTGPRVQRSGKRGTPQIADKEYVSSKGTPDRKPRRASVKSARRESAKKGNFVKDASPLKQSELAGKSSNTSGPSGIFQLVQPNEILHLGQMEGLGTKPFGALTTPPSSLPDLNSSAFPSMVFQQPFNDMQQVQLRAQILVYGSLISRQVPEELHMVSSFGGPDGGRSMWEKAWRTCKSRVSGQPPHPINLEAPNLSRSDVASNPASKQTKVTPSPAGRASTSGTPTPSINPMIPLSSPLWSLPTPSLDALQSSGLPRGAVMDYQPAFAQLTPHQTQPIISYVGHNTTWMSQTPFRGPWAGSPQSPALNSSIRFPSVPTESVQLTPVRESSLALSSGMKHVPAGPSAQRGVYPSATAKDSPPLELAKVIVQSGQPSADPKSKKRKKGPPSEDQNRIILQSQPHSENLSVPLVTSSLSASVTATTPASFLPKGGMLEFNVVPSPTPSTAPVKELDQGKMNPVLSEEVIGKVKDARQHAEDAAALATAAVSHSQEVWRELDKKKISGSVLVLEDKLASAAVAIAAAAAVAKAAAAAANVASNAALQAKAMADEASAGDYSNPNPTDSNTTGGGGMNTSSSIIFAAKEAARRRVEAASAAALRAENLDIIVKAAELAAEAITQAGKVVTMGDPISLRKLAEAGPEGFWKLPLSSLEPASEVHVATIEQANKDIACSVGLKKSSEGPSDDREAHVQSSASEEIQRNPMEDQVRLIVGISGSMSPGDEDRMGQKLPTTSDTGVNPESQYGLRSQDIGGQEEPNRAADANRDDGIQEGSRVEVFKDGDGYKGAWFPADVMSLKNGKAHVCYTELPSIKGSGKLHEWVDLKGTVDKAPRIRIPHPITAVQFDGSKKRRRAATGSFTCSIGDKVDAWIRDSWWEGVVTEKSKKDETSVTVDLPVLGETAVVKAWHLRPSLIWNDGEWIEWSSTRGNDRSHHEGDTPKEKRARLGSSGRKAKQKDKPSNTVEVPDSGKSEDPKLLDLSDGEKTFNIGKMNRDESKPDRGRTVRSGLRKQGPGVVFGVPKPGKKRKFMEVSKHYGDDQSNNKAEVNDSVKLANYLMPRGTGPRALKNAPRKENEAAEAKANVPTAVKSRGHSGRLASQKHTSKGSDSAPCDTSVADRVGKMKDSSGHVGKHNVVGTRSFSSSEGGAFSFSSRAAPSGAAATKKSSARSDSSGKLAKIEEDKIMNSSNSQNEPRRSNRRIQPTSRLLEGLQSSLIISKVPSSSHDKGQRSIRSGAKGNNQG